MMKSVKLAQLNIKNYNRQTKNISFILFMSMALFLLTTTLSKGFIKVCNSYKTDDITLCEIDMWPEDGTKFDSNIMENIKHLPHVEDVSQYYNIMLSDEYQLSISNQKLNVISMIRGTNRNFSFAPMKMILQNNENKYVNPIICGRNYKKNDEKKAIIDEGTCYILGYHNPEEILGEKITLELSNLTITDIEIVGVCSYLYGNYCSDLSQIDSLSRESYLNSEFCNPVFFSDDIIESVVNSGDVIEWDYENLVVYAESAEYVGEICNQAKELFHYDSSSMISAIEKKAQNINNICVILYVIAAIIFVISLVSIMNVIIIKIEDQKNFSEMIIKIGYRRREIVYAYVFENLFVTLKAGIKSIIITLFLSISIDMFISNGYRDITEYKRSLFLLDIPSALLFVFIISIFVAGLLYVITNMQISKIERKMLSVT